MKLWFKDSWEEEIGRLVKVGRLKNEDAQAFEAFFKSNPLNLPRLMRHRPKQPNWKHEVMTVRADCLARNASDWLFKREVMCKVISSSKSASGIKGMIDYITKSRDDDGLVKRPELFNGAGLAVRQDQVSDELQSWNLLKDTENFSKTARGFCRAGNINALNAMDDRERLGRVQGYHLIFSIDRRDDDPIDLPERFVRAMKQSIDEMFNPEGHWVLCAIHMDKPEHPHVHVVIRARSQRGRQLRFGHDGDYIHYLRIVFARNLESEGLPFTATRREDRYPLRARIIDGYERLRDSWHIRDAKRQPPQLAKRAGEAHPYLSIRPSGQYKWFANEAGWQRHVKSPARPRFSLRRAIKSKKSDTMWLKDINPAWWPLGGAITNVYAVSVVI